MIDPCDPESVSQWAASDTLPTGAPAVLAPDRRAELVTMPDDPYDALPPGLEVPRRRTPHTALELRTALVLGHHETTGQTIDAPRLRAAWCMLCVEHATHLGGQLVHGGAIWTENWGNIGLGSWKGDWCFLDAEEVLHSGRRVVRQRIRAHSGPVPGAADYWAFLLSGYPLAVQAMDGGDLEGVAAALKARSYYTALEHDYALGLVTWAREYDRRWQA